MIVREDLIGHAMKHTPSLLDYKVYESSHSLSNTNNTFAIYAMCLVMEWIKNEGGVEAMAEVNAERQTCSMASSIIVLSIRVLLL